MSDYVELHCHSMFSLLDGASSPEMLAVRAAALGLPALALTDHDDLGGIVRFATATRDVGIAGIVGAELTVEVPAGTHGLAADRAPQRTHLVLLAESRTGYGNLAQLITRARMDDRPRGEPAVSLETLGAHAAGLFALTGCPRGWVPALAAHGDLRAARRALGTLSDLFDGRVAVECWDHRLAEERALVRQLVPLARALGLPWVVTNDVHYADTNGRIVHDVLAALRHGLPLDAMGTRLRPNAEWRLQGARRMLQRWRHDPAGVRATVAVAERCAFRLEHLRPTLPAFPTPPGISEDAYLAELVAQGARERYGTPPAGAALPDDRSASPLGRDPWAQIAHELALIERLGLAGYFLIVWDIVRFARREGILCQGRGSAANSAVCYCLGITAVDPVRMELLFERFLSEERQEAPDIDLDFAHRERERVLQYVYARYGREHAAMVCEHITYRGRSAVRDAARVLGFSAEQAATLSAYSDRFSARSTADALRVQHVSDNWKGDGHDSAHGRRDADKARLMAGAIGSQLAPGTETTRRSNEVKAAARRIPTTAAAGATTQPPVAPAYVDPHADTSHVERRDPTTALFATTNPADTVLARAGLDPADPRVRLLADLVDGLHQAPRHRSIHVGGFVLTREKLSSVVPIEPASMANRTVIQWEKDDLDSAGLVKIDLLGLGILTVLQDCLLYLRTTRGLSIDLGALDMTDSGVYDDLCRADSIGVFQVESRAQQNTLPRLKPRCFYDLVVEVALIRPGPIQGDMVHPYLRRRAGLEAVTYPHPSLAPILKRTLGIPLFQEQGMQVAIACAGFTAGEADTLRRAMGHKRSRERMAEICEKLVTGMERNGIPHETALRIYNQINAFADYGFPESHAASFALLVYASAYLRHHYHPEYLVAMLNAQPMGFYAPGTLVEDARRHGVVVRPVDLTRSLWDATLEPADDAAPAPSDSSGGDSSGGDSSGGDSSGSAPPPRAPAVRLGLRSVRGLGAAARAKLEAGRNDGGGSFRSPEDVVRRTGLDRRTLRALTEAGAFDAFVAHEPPGRRRRAALWAVLDAERGDAGPLAPRAASPSRPDLPAMSPAELTEADYRMTGIAFGGHPMRHLRAVLAPNGVRTAADVQGAGRDGTRAAVAGLVICRQRPGTARGFVFLSLEDETGIVNVVVTPQIFEHSALLISTSPLLLVRGTLQVEGRVVHVRAEKIRALDASVGAEHARRHDFH